jgi:hypothetical protein
LFGLSWLDIVKGVPHGLKAGNICGGCGTTEDVPLADCAAVKENMQLQMQTQIPFGNDNRKARAKTTAE